MQTVVSREACSSANQTCPKQAACHHHARKDSEVRSYYSRVIFSWDGTLAAKADEMLLNLGDSGRSWPLGSYKQVHRSVKRCYVQYVIPFSAFMVSGPSMRFQATPARRLPDAFSFRMLVCNYTCAMGCSILWQLVLQHFPDQFGQLEYSCDNCGTIPSNTLFKS